MDVKTDEKRELTAVKVFYACTPKELHDERLDFATFAEARKKEIVTTIAPSLKRQRYYVWQLLLHALKAEGAQLEKTQFLKNEQGKWECSFCQFSLTHSDGVVAVALSEQQVGVDLEKIRPIHKKIVDKMFAPQQKQKLSELSEQDAQRIITAEWSKRESAYKVVGGKSVFDLAYDCTQFKTAEKSLCNAKEKFVLTVFFSGEYQVEFIDATDWLAH